MPRGSYVPTVTSSLENWEFGSRQCRRRAHRRKGRAECRQNNWAQTGTLASFVACRQAKFIH